jgi:hypothetical protein
VGHPPVHLCSPSTRGHQQDEPVSLRPLGSLHPGLMEAVVTAHTSRFHPHASQKRIYNFATVTPVLVRACSWPDQVLLRTICQRVLPDSFVQLHRLRWRETRMVISDDLLASGMLVHFSFSQECRGGRRLACSSEEQRGPGLGTPAGAERF